MLQESRGGLCGAGVRRVGWGVGTVTPDGPLKDGRIQEVERTVRTAQTRVVLNRRAEAEIRLAESLAGTEG